MDGSLVLYFNDPKKPTVHLRDDDPQTFLDQLKRMKLLQKLGESGED